jgi:hypothetical protein
MSFFCKHCDAEIEAPYEWGGMSLACPCCARVSPLQYKNGQRIAMSASGYGMSFGDFVNLVAEKSGRERAHPLIERLLACSIEVHGGGFILRAKSGTFIPCEVAHLRIQADPVAQEQLYQLAMTLWR